MAVAVLEVGGSHVTAAAVDPVAGVLLPGTRHRAPLDPHATAATLLDTIAHTANQVLATAPAHDRRPREGAAGGGGTHHGGTRGAGRSADGDPAPRARGRIGDRWGVALPGPFDYERGIAWYHDVGKFAALAGVPVGAELRRRLRRTPTDIRFLNDASAFALGAWREGPAAGSKRLVAVTLGTGVGSAFLDGGRVVEDDPAVPPEGRADLLTIDGAPLEDTVSTRALTGRYTAATGRAVDGLHGLARLADGGDDAARRIVETAMRRLGATLAPWIVSFGADGVVFGGSVTAVWPLIGPPLLAGLADHDPRLRDTLRVTVQPDGERTALLGAAVHATRPR